MISHNLAVLPPHQRTPHQLLGIRILLGNPLPRGKIQAGLARNLPLPRRKVLVPVNGQRLELQIVEVGECLYIRLFYFLMAEWRGLVAYAVILVEFADKGGVKALMKRRREGEGRGTD